MLESYEGTDGIKTGFTRASGFNLAASAERDGHRLIGVVLGSPSWPVRDKQMAALLDRGFAALGAVHVAGADTVEPTPAKRSAPPSSPVSPPMPRRSERRSRRRRRSSRSVGPRTPGPRRHRPARAADDRDRAIQLGAFRARTAAARLAKSASRLKPARGKDIRVLKIGGGRNGTLYAVQVSDFTDKGARDACGVLRKAKFGCFVVPEPDEG